MAFVRLHKNTVGTRKKIIARYMSKSAFIRYAAIHRDMESKEAGEEWVAMLLRTTFGPGIPMGKRELSGC